MAQKGSTASTGSSGTFAPSGGASLQLSGDLVRDPAVVDAMWVACPMLDDDWYAQNEHLKTLKNNDDDDHHHHHNKLTTVYIYIIEL